MAYDTTATLPSLIRSRASFKSSNLFGKNYMRWQRHNAFAGLANDQVPILQAAVDYVTGDHSYMNHPDLYIIYSYRVAFAWAITDYIREGSGRQVIRRPFYFTPLRRDVCDRTQRAQEKHLRLIELGSLLNDHQPSRAQLTSVA